MNAKTPAIATVSVGRRNDRRVRLTFSRDHEDYDETEAVITEEQAKFLMEELYHLLGEV